MDRDDALDTTLNNLLVRNCRKVDAEGIVDDFWVAGHGGVITNVGTGDGWKDQPDSDGTIDAGGRMITPGFIDIHCHGGAGRSFDEGIDGILSAVNLHRSFGTTRIMASLVTAPMESLLASMAAIRMAQTKNRSILGVHLEGPFLAAERRGAHNPDHLLGISSRSLSQVLSGAEGMACQVTIAPELPGAMEAIEVLKAGGLTVAVGHTTAEYACAAAAFESGASLLTHSFNAMNGLHHRDPGPIAAAFAAGSVHLELIFDGHHVHPQICRILFAAAPNRVVLVSDAMSGAGRGDGCYHLGDLDVVVDGGIARVAGTETIAGSTLTLLQALSNAHAAGVGLVEAVSAVTFNPAAALNLQGTYGLLAPGHQFDAVLLNPDFEVEQVWVSGSPV